MKLKFAVLGLLAAAGVFGLALDAGAVGSSEAVYTGLTPNGGTLAISSVAGSRFCVRGEQADGSYQLIWSGEIGSSGSVTAFVPHSGPTTNGQPQYVVSLRAPGGQTDTLYAVGPNPEPEPFPLDDDWWLD